uniref:C-type lectin domain-containing protein n=1 Tax=Kryptolebias marmoratus TaxID=37003 RepID=A0A3Q3GN93_KRYMA
ERFQIDIYSFRIFKLNIFHFFTLTKKKLKGAIRERSPAGKRCLAWEGDWEKHGGKFFYFNIYGFTWNESRASCRDFGGDLVKIDSREEVREMIKTDEDRFWIGLTDSETEGRWLWVDGSPLNERFDCWKKIYENPSGEDCVRMGRIRPAHDMIYWFDKSCDARHQSICEKPAEPGQSSCV